MKRLLALLAMAAMMATSAHAQFGLGKLKDRVKDKVKNKVEKTINKTVDNAVGDAKKKTARTAKGVVGDKVSDAVGLDDASVGSSSEGSETPSLAERNAFKKGDFREKPSPAISVNELDMADKATFDDNDGVSLDNISSDLSVGQLKVAATLYFRQQLKHLNAGNFDEIATEMANPNNTGVKIYEALDRKDMGEAFFLRKNLQQLNYYYTCCMFVGVPYNECSLAGEDRWNTVGADKQVKLALYGNLDIPLYTKAQYYKLYDYYVTIAERENKSDACKKLYLHYAKAYHDKPADKTLFSDENPEESDAEWKSLNDRLTALMNGNGGGQLKTIAQLRADKKEAEAALVAKENEALREKYSRLPEGINDPALEKRVMNYANKLWNSKNGCRVVKVILHKGWGYKTNILGMRIGRSKGATIIVYHEWDKNYRREEAVISDYSQDGKNYIPSSVDAVAGEYAGGQVINYKE